MINTICLAIFASNCNFIKQGAYSLLPPTHLHQQWKLFKYETWTDFLHVIGRTKHLFLENTQSISDNTGQLVEKQIVLCLVCNNKQQQITTIMHWVTTGINTVSFPVWQTSSDKPWHCIVISTEDYLPPPARQCLVVLGLERTNELQSNSCATLQCNAMQ